MFKLVIKGPMASAATGIPGAELHQPAMWTGKNFTNFRHGVKASKILVVGRFPGSGLNDRKGEDATIEVMGEVASVRGKAVLFDMDGTLVDSTRVVELAWGSWAARHNIPLSNYPQPPHMLVPQMSPEKRSTLFSKRIIADCSHQLGIDRKSRMMARLSMPIRAG